MSDSARVEHATALILVGLVLVFGTSPVDASSQNLAGKSDIGDWLYVDHDLARTRYSHLKQITSKNVSRLVKACAYSFADKEPSQTAPIVSAGRMYLTTAHYTVVVDGADCHVIWSSTWTPHEHEPANTHRGAALADGKIIRGTDDGFLLALDATDGPTLCAKQMLSHKHAATGSRQSDLYRAGGRRDGCAWLGGRVPDQRRRASVALQHRACRWRAGRRHLGPGSSRPQAWRRKSLDSDVV